MTERHFNHAALDLKGNIERDTIRKANNSLVLRADEIWVFGPISNGVLSEILIAQEANTKVHYFQIVKPHNIIPSDLMNIEMEGDIAQYRHLLPYQEDNSRLN